MLIHCSKHDNGVGADLPESEFYGTKKHSWCKECLKADRRRRYNNGTNIPTLQDRYNNARWQAKRRNISFTLTYNQWYDIISKPCSYGSFMAGIRIGIDRKNNNEGYTPENSVSCCARHNSIKGEVFNYEQFKEICIKYSDSTTITQCGNTLGGRPRIIKST